MKCSIGQIQKCSSFVNVDIRLQRTVDGYNTCWCQSIHFSKLESRKCNLLMEQLKCVRSIFFCISREEQRYREQLQVCNKSTNLDHLENWYIKRMNCQFSIKSIHLKYRWVNCAFKCYYLTFLMFNGFLSFPLAETNICLLIGSDGPFDYISVTPPYIQVDYGTLMAQISKSAIIGEDTFIVSSNLFLVQRMSLYEYLSPCFLNFYFHGLGSGISFENKHAGFMWMPCKGTSVN